MLTDLSNEIPLMKDWDPESLHSPIQETIPEPIYESNDVPIAKARPMAVSIPTTGLGRGDCFIDDVIKVYLARKSNIQRHAQSTPLAIHVSMRPHVGDDKEPVPR